MSSASSSSLAMVRSIVEQRGGDRRGARRRRARRRRYAEPREQRAVHDQVRIAPDRRGEVQVAGARQAEVAQVLGVVVGLLERAQQELREGEATAALAGAHLRQRLGEPSQGARDLAPRSPSRLAGNGGVGTLELLHRVEQRLGRRRLGGSCTR